MCVQFFNVFYKLQFFLLFVHPNFNSCKALVEFEIQMDETGLQHAHNDHLSSSIVISSMNYLVYWILNWLRMWSIFLINS